MGMVGIGLFWYPNRESEPGFRLLESLALAIELFGQKKLSILIITQAASC